MNDPKKLRLMAHPSGKNLLKTPLLENGWLLGALWEFHQTYEFLRIAVRFKIGGLSACLTSTLRDEMMARS
jgi:hypothetical protein